MACNPNAVATADSWLSLKDSPHQTLRAQYYFGRSLPMGASLPE